MNNRLINMLDLLQEYKHDKSTLMNNYISSRLDKSFNTYSKELQQSILYLTQKHEKSLLKRINKLDKEHN